MIYKLKIRKSQIITIITIVVSVACGVLFQKYVGVGKILKTIGVRHHLQPLITKLSLENNNPEEQHQGKLKLFILAGQSNMSGRGDLQQSGTNTNPNIYVFGNDYHWRLAAEPVDDPSNQVDKVSEDIGPGFSPSLSFATTILKQHPDMVIGLIPCAMGGSSICQWRRRLSDNSLYGSCLKRVRAASTMGDVAGLVFFQGESDALDPNKYPELTPMPSKWGDAFAAFVRDLRIDLNLPELPVVFAQIGTNTISRSDA